jgi:hypothetical protein
MRIHIFMCMFKDINIYICVYVLSLSTYIYIYIYIYIYVCVCVCVCMYVCIKRYVYIHICVCVCVCAGIRQTFYARTFLAEKLKEILFAGITSTGGILSTVNLLIKVACFAINVNKIFNIKSSCSEIVSTRRSTVPSPSL